MVPLMKETSAWGKNYRASLIPMKRPYEILADLRRTLWTLHSQHREVGIQSDLEKKINNTKQNMKHYLNTEQLVLYRQGTHRRHSLFYQDVQHTCAWNWQPQ